MHVLILLEPTLSSIDTSGRALIAAAQQLGQRITALVIGKPLEPLTTIAATLPGISTVLWACEPSMQANHAQAVTACVVSLADQYDAILAPASTFGKNVLPRIAAKLNMAAVSEVSRIISQDTFEHPIYAGNALETVQLIDQKPLLTIRTIAFDPLLGSQAPCPIQTITTPFQTTGCQLIKNIEHLSERPDLTQASVIVAGGRGLQSAAHFQLIESLADCLHAAIGASRAAVDAGWVPNDYQVGQTGKIVAPLLYIAVGISGAIQHVAGMQEAKIIVAINKDPDAPIFQIATYGLVGDLFDILPTFIALLKKNKGC